MRCGWASFVCLMSRHSLGSALRNAKIAADVSAPFRERSSLASSAATRAARASHSVGKLRVDLNPLVNCILRHADRPGKRSERETLCHVVDYCLTVFGGGIR